jgi:hypothetical protein
MESPDSEKTTAAPEASHSERVDASSASPDSQVIPKRKGRKAFEDEVAAAPAPEKAPEVAQEKVFEAIKSDLLDDQRVGALGRTMPMDADSDQILREEIQRYCRDHFERVAKSVIESELGRLANERARHLVDH